MKSNKIVKPLAVLCAAVLLAISVTDLFPIALAEQYHTGGAEISETVKNLDINWTSGRVNIAYHSGNTVIISEKSAGAISKDRQMRWCLDGDTLRIEYQQPGLHLFSIFSHEKELTVTLPKDRALEKANIYTTSGELSIPALYADSLTLKTTSSSIRAAVNARTVTAKMTSGDMELQVLNEAEEISLKAVSGEITLESAGTAGKTVIETTSGSIRATVKAAGELKAASTSGDIQAVVGSAKKAEIGSVSGKVFVKMAALDELGIRTTSGDVTVYLPAAPGFTASIETTSGNVLQNLPMTKNGKDYVAGDGSAAVKIHTTSGDITLSSIQN
ncbi:MAG: DUF4097 family beta strand repeat protein [Clostridia bacterium]|nr:DUF4097 family beta strand repeat protein [Clostridia bacterium]